MSKNKHPKKYENYSLEDFLSDEFFIQWVKSPNENNSHFWEKWLNLNPQKREIVTEAASFVRSVHYQDKYEFSNVDYIEVFENILLADVDAELSKKMESIQPNKWYSLFSVRRAAAIILIAFSCWALYQTQDFSDSTSADEVEWITKTNESGKKTVIHLNDGSTIHLNSNSSITFPKVFSESSRLVSMIGEAFFDVKKEDRPFIVDLKDAQVEVLGTSFNVNHFEGEKLEVALVEGKVKVNDDLGNQVILAPSEMLVMGKSGEMYKKNFDARTITGWKDKYLVFSEADFITVVQKIESWYGVKIQAEGMVNSQWSYTGQYYDETLENVLEGIAQTSKIKYTIKGNEVSITNNPK